MWSDWYHRVRAILSRRTVERELDAELQLHLEQQAEKYRRAGFSPEEAARRARLDLGGVDWVKEQYRDSLGTRALDSLGRDLRYAFRSMRASPVFTVVVVASLALAIGANTSVFSLVNVLMLRDLTVRNPSEIVEVGRALPQAVGASSYPLYTRIRDRNTVFDGVSAVSSTTVAASIEGAEPQPTGRFVTGNFFNVLGISPAIGRLIEPADDRAEGAQDSSVVVIAYRLWQQQFDNDPSVIGKALTIGRGSFTIVGVLPRSFEGLTVGRPDDFFIPISSQLYLERRDAGAGWLNNPGTNWLKIVGRLAPAAVPDGVQSNLDVIFSGFIDDYAPKTADEARLREIRSQRLGVKSARAGVYGMRDELSRPALLLMGAVSLVLLIACANISSLLLARGMARRREIGIRTAIGASRGRLVRQLLTESAALGMIGGTIGFAVATWATRMIGTLIADGDPAISLDMTPDRRVMLFTALVALGSALLAGLTPAMRVVSTMTTVPEEIPVRHKSNAMTRWTRALTAVQVALSLLLLTGATLLIASLRNLETFDAGFERDHVLLMGLKPATAGYADNQRLDYYREVLQRTRNMPGVHAAGLSLITPISSTAVDLPFTIEGQPTEPDAVVYVNNVSDGYFAAMGTRLLLGRDFGRPDRPDSVPVAVINDAVVRRYFKGESPIGSHVRVGNRGVVEIVGVVANAKYLTLREDDFPTVYVNAFQSSPPWGLTLVIQTEGKPDSFMQSIRREVKAVAPAAQIVEPTSFVAQIDRSLSKERMMTRILGSFAALAVLLTSAGLYGVLAYNVARRTGEFGIRLALGARRGMIAWSVIRESWSLVAVGAAIGIPASLALTRLLSSLLFDVRPTDPWILGGVILLLLVVAFTAALQPAWRALRLDPLVALRHE